MSYLQAAQPTVTTTLTVGEIIELALLGKLILQPNFQREYVAKEKWARNYIGSVIQRSMNSAIHLRKLKDGRYEVIDGLQRITTLVKFFKGELKTPTYINGPIPVYFEKGVVSLPPSTMKEIQKLSSGDAITKRFKEFGISCIVYDESMTDDEASEVFWTLNDNNDLTPQEKRNGILGAISEYVREVSRVGQKYPILPVFGVIGVSSNGRMNLDEMIARAVQYEVWNQTKDKGIYFGYANAENLDDLYKAIDYRSDVKAFEPIRKEVERRFEIVRKIVQASGAPKLHTKNTSKVLTLYQLTYALEEKFGKSMKIDFEDFSQNLWAQLSMLGDTSIHGVFNRKKTEYNELIGLYAPDEVARKMALILGNIQDIGITVKDKRRFFSADEKYRRWEDQERTCALTGEPIDFIDAVGGHIIPHSKGGKTTYDNLVVLSKKSNAMVGDIPFYEYKQKYDAEQVKLAA